MKKVLITLLALAILVVGGGYAFYRMVYGGGEYYVKITTNGIRDKVADEYAGKKYYDWNYNLPGYDKNGKEKDLKFTAQHQLRKEAYLDVTYSKDKGVTSWKEVKENKVPKAALDKLSQ